VGRGASRRSYAPVVARHFVAGRGAGEKGFANSPAQVDLAYVWGLDTTRMSGFEMIGLADALTASGQWVVFVFHGIAEGGLAVSQYDFDRLLDFLARRRDTIWTAPLVDVARKIGEVRKADQTDA
jgi:peptidoglycan-N-acetylglucosamine deacetylase